MMSTPLLHGDGSIRQSHHGKKAVIRAQFGSGKTPRELSYCRSDCRSFFVTIGTRGRGTYPPSMEVLMVPAHQGIDIAFPDHKCSSILFLHTLSLPALITRYLATLATKVL